jgi:hypothetical protein
VNEFKLSLKTIVSAYDKKNSLATIISSDVKYVDRVLNTPLTAAHYDFLKDKVKYVGVTSNFREVIDYFKTPHNHSPGN